MPAKLVLTVLLLLALAGCTQSAADIVQERGESLSPELAGSVKIGQTFIPDTDGLDQIAVALAHNNRALRAPVVLHLQEAPGAATDLQTITLPVGGVNRAGYTAFHFPRIEKSAGHSYYFYVAAPEAKPSGAVQVFMSDDSAYTRGQAYLDGTPQSANLAFRVYTSREFSAADVWAQLGRRLAEDSGFAACYALLLLVVIGLWVLTAVRERARAGAPGRADEV